MKKIVSIVLVVVMVLSLAVVAFAAKLGDVDGNGRVTSADALMVLQYVAGSKSLTEEQQNRADANKDGTLGAVDARKILQIVAGLLPEEDVKEEETTEDSITWDDIINAGK